MIYKVQFFYQQSKLKKGNKQACKKKEVYSEIALTKSC